MSSLLTSFLRHMLRHSHVTIMKIVHLDAVKIDCTTILCDESQDLNASHAPSGKRIPQETQRPCHYPPAKEFHKRHKQMNRMCEHSQKFGKCLMLNKMCSCWGRDTALHHMSSLLMSFLRWRFERGWDGAAHYFFRGATAQPRTRRCSRSLCVPGVFPGREKYTDTRDHCV